MPAIFKGELVTGRIYGMYEVLGRVGTQRFGSGSKHPIWTVRCVGCGNIRELPCPNVIRNKRGCRECAHEAQSGSNGYNWRGGRHVPAYFMSHVRSLLQRGTQTLVWDLSVDYLDDLWETQDGRCVYTGWKLQFGTVKRKVREQTASLDRIDSSVGYIEGNVQFVHKDVNRMKLNYPEERFVEICEAITNHRKAA